MTKRLQKLEEFDSLGRSISKENWTAVIPAAGRGTRLGLKDKPKILLEVHGHTLLYWILQNLKNYCEDIIFIVSPEFHSLIEKEAEALLPNRCRFVVQEKPLGMADAIYKAKDVIRTPKCLVMWGDQIAIKASTLEACMKLHSEGVNLTLPTVLVEKPYIHFVRDSEDRIVKVQERREGTITMEIGESDCGLFLFRSAELFSILRKNRKNPMCIGKATGEWNLLPLIPLFENEDAIIASLRLTNKEEAIGINTQEDAKRVESLLKGDSAYDFAQQ